MSAIRKGVVPIITSRRALQKLTPKFPKHLKEIIKQEAKKDDPAWPDYMRRAGYTVMAIAVPYSVMAIISESPRLRDKIEGDPGAEDGDSLGAKVVDFVRWYFGREDDIPYSEYLETDKHNELSLFNDLSTTQRKVQERIQQRLRDELTVNIETEAVGDDRSGVVDGRAMANISKIMADLGASTTGQESNRVRITFEDSPEKKLSIGEGEFGNDFESVRDYRNEDVLKRVSSMTSIWSAWYYFPSTSAPAETTQPAANTKSGKTAQYDSYQPIISNLTQRIEDLQKDLSDPNCFRDRDDMESEIKQMRKEITSLTRERRLKKLKSFVSLS